MKNLNEFEMPIINKLIIVILSVIILSILLLLFMQYLLKISNIQKNNFPFTDEELIKICQNPTSQKKKIK